MHNLKNLLDLAKQQHRRDLENPYATTAEWLKGHPAIGGERTPKFCTTCWIIEKAKADIDG